MRHLLMDPAFPDIVGELVPEQIDDRARVWIIERGNDGQLAERVDPGLLPGSTRTSEIDQMIEALLVAAAEQDVAETRTW